VDRLLEAQQWLERAAAGAEGAELLEEPGGLAMALQPVVDGEVLFRRPIDAVAEGMARPLDLMIGTTAEEWRLFVGAGPEPPDDGDIRRLIDHALSTREARCTCRLRQLLAQHRGALVDLLVGLETERTFRLPAIRLAEEHDRHGGSVYAYLFSWRSPDLGACHGVEIPYAFDGLGGGYARRILGRSASRELASLVNAAWVHFARAGDPSVPGRLSWPRYARPSRPTAVFDEYVRVVADPCSDEGDEGDYEHAVDHTMKS
jgi:para-nitrobenzyl esterase